MGVLTILICPVCFFYIFTFLSMENEAKQINESSIYSTIRASINHLCPYSNICEVNPRSDDLRDHDVPCCKGCSCEESCKKNENCCFPDEKDGKQYTSDHVNDTNKQKWTKVENTPYSCLFPGTAETFPDTMKHIFKDSAVLSFYDMIDVCPSVPEIEHDPHTTSHSCGEMTIASWGSLLPLYSPSRRKVYKNNKCAECHNVTDGIIWDVIQTCSIKTYWNNADVSVMVNVLKRQSKALDCFQIFTYPGKLIDIEHRRCYKDVVGHCGQQNYDIPYGTSLSRADIEKACGSGFFSPIYGVSGGTIPTTFTNVYCAICNSARLDTICKNSNTNVRQLGQALTYILKGSFVLQNQEDDVAVPAPTACTSISYIDLKDNTECRLLHCSAGQVRINGINCQFPSKYWSSVLHVVLELTPLNDVPISLINEMEKDPFFSWLLSPWPIVWKMTSVIFETRFRHGNVFLKQLYVYLRLSTVSYNIVTQVQVVKRTLSKMWKIQLNDTVIPLQQKMSSIRDFSNHANARTPQCAIPLYLTFDLSDSWSFLKNNSMNNSTCTFRFIQSNVEVLNAVTINKLFYCPQVELNSTEVELTAGNRVLYYKSKQEYYFENEFTFLEDRQAGTYSVRLCASDAGFHYRPVSSNNRLFSGPMTYLTLLSFILYLLRSHFYKQ